MADTDLLCSMTAEPEPTREHLAERLSVLERELARAKQTILHLECERDELRAERDQLAADLEKARAFPGPSFELDRMRKDFDRVKAQVRDLADERDAAHGRLKDTQDTLRATQIERDKLLSERDALKVERDNAALNTQRVVVDVTGADQVTSALKAADRQIQALAQEREKLTVELQTHRTRWAGLLCGYEIETPEDGFVVLASVNKYAGSIEMRAKDPARFNRMTCKKPEEPSPVKKVSPGVEFTFTIESITGPTGEPISAGQTVALLTSGRPPNTPTPKKPRPDLIPAASLIEAGWCMAGGLERDDPNGQPWYETAPPAEARRKYHRSMLRHVLDWYAGNKVDADSKRSPLAHIICNAAILLSLELRGK